MSDRLTHMQAPRPSLSGIMVRLRGMLRGLFRAPRGRLKSVYRLALVGTAVCTGIHSPPGSRRRARQIALSTGRRSSARPQVRGKGAHDALVQLSAPAHACGVALQIATTSAASCGPRAGSRVLIPENEAALLGSRQGIRPRPGAPMIAVRCGQPRRSSSAAPAVTRDERL